MEYNRITYFLKAAQLLSFSKAADELFISRQAMTKQISLFEKELGVVLFNRNSHKISLTDAGCEAYARFKKVNMELEEAYESVRSLGHKDKVLKIGFFYDLQRRIINNIIEGIEEEFPDIVLETMILDMFTLRSLLQKGSIDLCITHLEPGEQWQDYNKLVLGLYPLQIYVSKEHGWALKDHITVEDMLGEDFLMLKVEWEDSEYFYENIPCKKQVWMPNLESIILRLEQARGFAVGPKYSNFFHDTMIPFPVPDSNSMAEMSCFWNDGKNKSEQVDRVVELLSDLFVQSKLQ